MQRVKSAIGAYALPEQAHFSLVQVTFFLRTMAQLTEPGTNASLRKQRVTPDGFGWCFAHLSKEMDSILDATLFSTEAPNLSPATESCSTGA